MKDPAFAKFVVLVNGAVPLALLGWDAYRGQLPNWVDFTIKTTGMLTLIFLILSLTVTPLRLVSGRNWLSHFRRMLGLYAFFYGMLHLLTYFIFPQSASVRSVASDTIKRPFILAGMTALLLMTPLAITSTNAMVKRLGAARWKRLHQLAYPSAAAGVLHYYLLVKADVRQPIAFAIVLAMLLGYRVAVRWFPSLRYRQRVAAR